MAITHELGPLVEFLGLALGPRFEVVLHDLAEPDRSIVAIANGEISGRHVGGPVTDLALKFLKKGAEANDRYVINYQGRNSNGRICRSSSFFVRDDQGALLAVLCINVDVTDLMAARDLLTRDFIGDSPSAATSLHSGAPVRENLQGSLDDLMRAMLDEALAGHQVEPGRLSSDERRGIVEALNEAGLFLLKGGVAAAAERLAVSEPTIYRYLSKVKRSE